MNYTDKYLIKDISNKAFRLKYGAKSKKSIKKKVKKWNKSKKERQKWWRNLTSDEQQVYIEKKQAQKAEERKDQLERVLRYNPKYPWLTEGVNDTNKAEWWAMILRKNPWLKVA